MILKLSQVLKKYVKLRNSISFGYFLLKNIPIFIIVIDVREYDKFILEKQVRISFKRDSHKIFFFEIFIIN